MSKKKTTLTYKILKLGVKLCYPKIETVGAENIPEEPSIIVGNHCQINGPIACELYFPVSRYTWCAGQMMKLKTVPAYAFEDFWSQKPRWTHWFYKTISVLIAPLSVCVFNNSKTIGVYRDTRILSTFKNTVKLLGEGEHIVIFPEQNVEYNHIIYDFQDKFIDVAKLYYKKTGKELQFVPLYIAPKLKKMYLGKPIRFCAENDIDSERQRIKEYLMKEVTDLACSAPEHIVVPYRNIKKKDYPLNTGRRD